MIDEEIKGALNVDPSPEFLARVRTRIANEPPPSAWRWSWTVAAAGAMATAVVIAAVVTRPGPQGTPLPDVVAGRPALAPAFGPVEPAMEPRRPTETIVRHRGSAASGVARTVISDPQVLIDPRETRALRQLITGVRDGRIDLTAAQHSTPPPTMELPPLTDIVIDPITIDPIAPQPGAEGVRP